MNANNSKVTNGRCGVSVTSSTGTRDVVLGVYIYRPGEMFRDGKTRIQKLDHYGRVFANKEDADAFTLEHGYSKRYGRNTMQFIMSRAARRRGLTTTNRTYNDPSKQSCWIGGDWLISGINKKSMPRH